MKEQLANLKSGNDISKAFALVNPHLYTVEERIRTQARTFDPAIEGYVAYACNSRGKRIRPALALLAGGATGRVTSAHVDLAVVMELIHLATLVHDDIIDGAELRRSQPTANAKWGNSLSVLLGDVLFAHALRLATSLHDNDLSRRIAEAASDVCSGEILQTQRRFDLNLNTGDYFHIIELKTAALFAASAELGAYLSKADPDTIATMRAYGHKLGTDFKKGKLTLPVLAILGRAASPTRDTLHELLIEADESAMREIAAIVRSEGGLDEAVDSCLGLITEAAQALHQLDRNPHTIALGNVANYLRGLVESISGDD